MAIRSVLQKMLDQGGNGISPEEFEEVKSFTSTFPGSKGVLQKMLDQGGNGISPEEFEQIKTWSSDGMVAAKSQVRQETQAAEDANGVLPKLGGIAKDVALTLGVQGIAGVAGQVGTLVAQNPLEALGKTAAKTAGVPALEHLDLITPMAPIKLARELGKKSLPEAAQNALLLNPDNWLTQGARDVSQWAQGKKTEQQQEAERTAQESAKNATTIGGKIYESTIGNPQALAATALQSAPQLLVGGAVAKVLRGAGMAANAATRTAALTGSAMQSADTWQDTYFGLLENADAITKTPEYQRLVATGLSSDVALRKVARAQADDAMTMSGLASAATTFLPGANSIEGAFARGAGQASRFTMKNIAKTAGTFAAESGQEFGEEYSAAVAKNLASNPITGVDPFEGALQQGATGAALGGIMSGPTAAGNFQAPKPGAGAETQQIPSVPSRSQADLSPAPQTKFDRFVDEATRTYMTQGGQSLAPMFKAFSESDPEAAQWLASGGAAKVQERIESNGVPFNLAWKPGTKPTESDAFVQRAAAAYMEKGAEGVGPLFQEFSQSSPEAAAWLAGSGADAVRRAVESNGVPFNREWKPGQAPAVGVSSVAPTPVASAPASSAPIAPLQTPTASVAPVAPAPAAPTQAIPETQPDLASRAMAAKQRGVEEDFAEFSNQGPEFAQKVAEWRGQNPNGEFDQFDAWVQTQPRAQAEAAVQSAPEVVQAQADASRAAQKVEVAQQVPNSDPTQAPPPGLTAEEARDIQQNGTESIEKEAKAAEEQARTVAQTKAKEIEQNSPDTPRVKAAAEAVKQSRKTRKTQAKEAFTSKLKAMSEGAMEWNEDMVRTHAEDAGIGPEAIEAKLASARKRLDKTKAAEAKKVGKEAPTPAPAESTVEEAKAEFTPPTQGAEASRIDSAPNSDLETKFAEEIAQEHIKKGFEAAKKLRLKGIKQNKKLGEINPITLSNKIESIVLSEGAEFNKNWRPLGAVKSKLGKYPFDLLSDNEIIHYVYSEFKNKGEAAANKLYKYLTTRENSPTSAEANAKQLRGREIGKRVISLLERNGIPVEKGWKPPKKGATESAAQAEPVTEAPIEETPNEDGVMPIEQPEDGTVLSDIQNSGLDKVPMSRSGVYPLESVPEGSTPAEIVGVIHAPGQQDGYVVFRHKDGYAKIPQSQFKGMAQVDTGWSVDPNGDLVAERADGSVVATTPAEATAQDSDNISRIERQPVQGDSQEGFIRSVTPESILDAANRTGIPMDEAEDAANQWQEALDSLDSAESFGEELGTIADSGADLTMAQLNALANRARSASENVQAVFAKMLPALEILATAEALDLMENSPAPRLDRADISIAKGWGFYHELEQIAESVLPRWAGSSSRAADYLAWKFQEHTGKPVTDATADEVRVWAQNQVKLNANNLPAWMWAAMGGSAALVASGVFLGIGAAAAIATGFAAIKAIQALNYIWGKYGRSGTSPRSQILRAISTAKHSSADVMAMLDQAFIRALEIKGPAMNKMRGIKKKYFGKTGGQKFPELGRVISNIVEGKARNSVPGMTDAQVDEAAQQVKSILGYFRNLMLKDGMPTIENYLPRMIHADGFAEMMADPVAKQTVIDDTAEKVEKHMPDAVTDKVHEMAMSAWAPETNAQRRRRAAVAIANDILSKRENDSSMEKYGVAKTEYTRLASPSPTKARSLPFDLMEEVKDSSGKILPLIERDAFKILDRYIPSMSRAIAHRETVNKHRINQWLDGLQLPPGTNPNGEKPSQYRSRILSYVQNDLDQSLSRMLTGGNQAEFARKLRIANTIRFLAVSIWYPMMNLSFGTPLAFGLTGARGGMTYTTRMLLSMVPYFRFGRKEAELAGAITDGIHHDINAGEGGKMGRVVDLVSYPSAFSQEAVDVGGFYAGRAVAPRLLARAKKGDLHSKKMLGDALGEEGARDAMDRGVLTNDDLNRIGLFFKTKISGTARSANLPALMGTDLGRTIFQFGSIPMEQTKTLVEDILGSGKSFGVSRNTGTFAIGAGLSGLASLTKLAGMSALSTGIMGNPESDRRKWMRKQSMFELLLWAAVKGGSFQLLTPLLDMAEGGPQVRDAKKTILDLLPMPTASIASLGYAGIQSGKRGLKSTFNGKVFTNPTDQIPFIALPVIRDLVNNQTSLFRGLGIKIPERTRLEKRNEKKD